jgi:L-asparagine transporter-like permease
MSQTILPATVLKRRLSTGQLSMIAIGGAIGTGLFLGSGFAISLAGPAVLISYAIGGLVALLLMGCLAEMTVVHPSTGSFGWLAQTYVGPLAGYLIRYAYWSANVLAVGTEVTAVALYMRYWLPDLPGWWWILGFSGVLVTVNAVSVQMFGWVEYCFSFVKIAAILAFLVLGGWTVLHTGASPEIGLANYTRFGGFLPHGLGGMWVAVVVSIFSYLGIETIAVAAGEAQDPERVIVRALRTTMARLGFFYLATLAVMLAVIPWTRAAAGTSPFVTVMVASGVPGAASLINLVILIAALSAMNTQIYASSRMLFSLAQAGQAPAVLGRVSPSGVPLPALLASSFGIAAAAILYVLAPEQAFTVMIALSMSGALFTWAMIFVTHLCFRRARRALPLRFAMWGSPWTSLLGLGLMVSILVTTAFTSAFRLTLAYGVPALLGLCVAYLVRAKRRKEGLLF